MNPPALREWPTAFEAFLDAPDLWEFLAPWARASRCLPVYCDWTHAIGVTEQGRVVVFQHEVWPGISGPPDGELADIRLVNVALRESVKRYAWLTALLPVRPRDAQSCSMCEGAGTFPAESVAGLAELVCYCGGAGWVPATDTWVNKRRFDVLAVTP